MMEGEKLFLFHIKLFLTDKKLFKIEIAKFETTSKLELTEGVASVPLMCMHTLPNNSLFHYLLWHACALYQEIFSVIVSFTVIQPVHH